MTKNDFDKWNRIWPEKEKKLSDIKVVEDTVDLLLRNLYHPTEDKFGHGDNNPIGFRADPVKVKRYELDEEAINWGDLGVVEVEKFGEKYFISIEEVAPNSFHLIAYIEKFMNAWGWDVRVSTEW